MKNAQQINETIGRKIAFLRINTRLSQSELAQRLNMKGPQLSKIENGKNLPSSATLVRIENALGRPAGELTELRESLLSGSYIEEDSCDIPRLVPTHETHEIPEDLDKRLQTEILPVLDEYLELQKKLNVPSFVPAELYCQAVGVSPGDAEILAHIIRSSIGAGAAPISGLVPLLEANNVRILFTPILASEMHAKSYIDNQAQNLVVCVSEHSTPERQLNDICRELAFACMFIHKSRMTVEQTHGNNQFAQSFAQAFLMPRSGIRLLMGQLNITSASWSLPLVCKLKIRFGVSAQLFIHRIKALGLVERETFERLRAQIHEHYDRIMSEYEVDSAEFRRTIEPLPHAPELQHDLWIATLRAANH